MDKYSYARDMFISFLRKGEKDNFTVSLIQKKLRVDKKEADAIHRLVIESVKH